MDMVIAFSVISTLVIILIIVLSVQYYGVKHQDSEEKTTNVTREL